MSRTAAVIEPVIGDSELLLFITSSSQRWQIYLPCGPRVWRGQRARVRSPGRGWRVFGTIGAGAFRRSGLVKLQMVPIFCTAGVGGAGRRYKHRAAAGGAIYRKLEKMGHSHLLLPPPLARGGVERRVR